MIPFALTFAIGCFGIGLLLCLVRVIRAPTTGDRVLALDNMSINAIALLILYGMQYGTRIYFEAAILIAMLGFVSTIAYLRFMLRGNIIE